MPTVTQPLDKQNTPSSAALLELQAIRQELAALRQLLDSFAAVFLRAKFPHGRPTDRWRDR